MNERLSLAPIAPLVAYAPRMARGQFLFRAAALQFGGLLLVAG